MANVVYASAGLIDSFYAALSEVASERVYIEMIEPPPLEKVRGFQTSLIEKNGPVFYAVETGDTVVGWADIFPSENPRLKHRGSLGMGLVKSHRGQGLGTKLLSSALAKAKEFGLEKVELTVYTTNTAAIALYKKLGFEIEGHIKHYRKLDGVYFDCLAMGKFL